MDLLERLAVFFSAILPVAWLGLLFAYAARDRMTQEAIGLALMMGLFAASAVLVVASPLSLAIARGLEPSFTKVLVQSFFGAALPEETAKLIFLLTIVYRHEDIETSFGRVLAGGMIGLGFGALENVLYVFGHAEEWKLVAFYRALSAVPSHTVSGLIMGVLLARASEPEARRSLWIAAALLVPTLLHGWYDASIFLLRDEFRALLPPDGRWLAGFGLAVALATEITVAILLVMGCLRLPSGGLASHPPMAGATWEGYSSNTWLFRPLLALTFVIAISIGVGGFALQTKPGEAPAFLGLGLEWLGIAYMVRRLHLMKAL